jgi:hypothetical protein
MGGFSLVFAAVGSIIFGLWLALEVWIRRAPVEDLAFTTREEKGGSEGSYYRVRVQVPSSYQINDKWVWISAKQYETLEGVQMMPVHVRRSGDRIFLRGVRHRGRVWLIGFIAFYFSFNLIIILFDL